VDRRDKMDLAFLLNPVSRKRPREDTHFAFAKPCEAVFFAIGLWCERNWDAMASGHLLQRQRDGFDCCYR
jgi:hypothetical protein